MPREDIVGELAVLWIECDGVEHNGLGLGVARGDPYDLAANVERAPSIVRKAMRFFRILNADYSPLISAIDLASR